MRSNPINFLYNLGHVTFWCVEVRPVANASEGSTQEHDWAGVPLPLPLSGFNQKYPEYSNVWTASYL